MPNRQGTPCRDRQCAGVVLDGKCSLCGKGFKRDFGRSKDYDGKRGTSAQRGYDSRWEKVRKMYLSKHPLCERCEASGIVTVALDVHHIRPLKQGGSNSEDNLMALCRKHHMEVEASMKQN